MPVTSFTARRIELVRRQQDLTVDMVRAADAIAIYAQTLQQATLREHPLDTIARQARRLGKTARADDARAIEWRVGRAANGLHGRSRRG